MHRIRSKTFLFDPPGKSCLIFAKGCGQRDIVIQKWPDRWWLSLGIFQNFLFRPPSINGPTQELWPTGYYVSKNDQPIRLKVLNSLVSSTLQPKILEDRVWKIWLTCLIHNWSLKKGTIYSTKYSIFRIRVYESAWEKQHAWNFQVMTWLTMIIKILPGSIQTSNFKLQTFNVVW